LSLNTLETQDPKPHRKKTHKSKRKLKETELIEAEGNGVEREKRKREKRKRKDKVKDKVKEKEKRPKRSKEERERREKKKKKRERRKKKEEGEGKKKKKGEGEEEKAEQKRKEEREGKEEEEEEEKGSDRKEGKEEEKEEEVEENSNREGEEEEEQSDSGEEMAKDGKRAKRLNLDDSYLIDHLELKYKECDLIGQGHFGSVYRGRLYGKDVAIKKFHQQDVEKNELQDLINEIKILSKLHHPNVLLLIGVCVDVGHLAIVTEIMSGNLFNILHSTTNAPPPLRKRLRYASDCCLGMAYLHRPNCTILHRDLKALNLLVDKNGTVKVADFGISQMNFSKDGAEKAATESYFGSTAWVAPEIFQGQIFTAKSDVYSFAVVLWEILTCEIPWKGVNGAVVINKVSKKKERPEIPESCTPKLRKLIENCWHPDIDVRPSFSEILPEIRLCIVESSIFDPDGIKFWMEYFPDQQEVDFDTFSNHFVKEYRIRTSELTLPCLRAVICDKEQDDLVSMASFNKCLLFFGPLDGKAQNFVDRIALMLEKPYFHGDIEKDDAIKLLGREKKTGTYLVRFSGASQVQETLGNYALSIRKKSGSVAHIRLTGGGGTVCDNLEKFIKVNKKDIGLKHPCPGSKYRQIFMRNEADTDMAGYGYINPVDMSAPSLRVDKKK